MPNKKKRIDITPSCGNVFADLALKKSEELLAKAELVFKINKLIKEKKLKQHQAADILEIDQPKISALIHGKLTGFSIERLFKFLTLLDQDIEIIIKPHAKSKTRKSPHHLHLQVRHA